LQLQGRELDLMIIRSGIDTIEISRLEEIQPAIRARFMARVFTASEIVQARDRTELLAGLFAAKEAVSKALGTGIGKISWQEIEVLHLPSGQPVLHLHGSAQTVADELGLESWSVSISHDRSKAVAVAVAIGS
jgi:holo-[acyl-carrier protein] synthase